MPGTVTVQWSGDDFEKYVSRASGSCVAYVANSFADHMKGIVGKKGKGSAAGGSAVTKAGKKLAKSTVGRTSRLSRTDVARSIKAGRKKAGGSKTKSTRGFGFHVPSRPGDPPAIDTGLYQSSIQVDASGAKGKTPVALIGTKLAYGRWLEFGTRHMAARPHWRPQIKKMAPKLVDLYARCLESALKRYRGKR